MTVDVGNHDHRLADDIIYGATAVAVEMFGSPDMRRRVYQLVEQGKLPAFRLGATICARRSVLRKYIEEQERAVISNSRACA